MAYQYREEMFPTRVLRQAFDALQAQLPARAVREYLHVASTWRLTPQRLRGPRPWNRS
jgi:hypothetical protein